MRLIQLFEALNINDAGQVRDRVNLYKRIIATSHHQGEKDNAQTMMDRLIAQAKQAGTKWETNSGGTTGHRATQDAWERTRNAERDRARQARQDAEDRDWARQKAHSTHDPKWEMRDKFARRLHMPMSDVIEVQEYGNVWVAYFRNVDNPKTFDVAEYNFINNDWITQHPFPNYPSSTEAKYEFNKAAIKRKKLQDGFDRKYSSDFKSDSSGPGPFKIYFVGHYQDDKSDKVWGWGVKGEKLYQFWGKRGGTPQTKVMPKTAANEAALRKLAEQKAAKGYNQQSAANFEEFIKNVLKRDPKFSD